MSNRYFHRTFLAKSDDDSSNEAIIARVTKTGDDWLSANLLISGDYDSVSLYFGAWDEEALDESIRRAELLSTIISDFAKAVKAEAQDVRKKMKEAKKEK